MTTTEEVSLQRFKGNSGSNVKTVKEQMFHKSSTSVPINNKNVQNFWIRSRSFLIERDHFYLVQEIRFWTKLKQQSVFNKTYSGTIPKRIGFVSKTISERLSFRFWHYWTVVPMKPSYKEVLIPTKNCYRYTVTEMVNKLNIQQGFRIGVDSICSSVH